MFPTVIQPSSSEQVERIYFSSMHLIHASRRTTKTRKTRDIFLGPVAKENWRLSVGIWKPFTTYYVYGLMPSLTISIINFIFSPTSWIQHIFQTTISFGRNEKQYHRNLLHLWVPTLANRVLPRFILKFIYWVDIALVRWNSHGKIFILKLKIYKPVISNVGVPFLYFTICRSTSI